MAKKSKSDKSGKKSVKPVRQTGDAPETEPRAASRQTESGSAEAIISPRRRQRAGEAAPPLPPPASLPIQDAGPASARVSATAPTTALITGLTALANRSALVVDGRVRAAGLRTADLSVYALLALGPKLTPGDIAESTGMAATTVSSLLRRAEERGDVERTPNPRDARSSFLVLTDSGRFRFTEALVYLDPLVRELKQAGVPTGTQVVSALGVLRRWVDAMGSDGWRG